VIAIMAFIAAMAMPMLPRGTSRSRLESYAIETAAVLKADRNAAIRRRTETTTEVNAKSRRIRSGSTGRVVQMPSDVEFDALLAERCERRPAGSAIHFFLSGMSCGGVIALSRPGIGYQVRVNWLTGGVDIVPFTPS
jgi:general secretion pathway protein H